LAFAHSIRGVKVILDLCGGTGAWSKPYAEAGYEVRLITLPVDVRLVEYPSAVHGLLAAPPCQCFSRAGRRWPRSEADYLAALSVVDACLRFVAMCKPAWWALENPVGNLRKWIGQPVARFQPFQYGDPYSKLTCLWGNFTMPEPRNQVESLGSLVHHFTGSRDKEKRAITPPGFARAFFEANP
jgi:hypothetical protein